MHGPRTQADSQNTHTHTHIHYPHINNQVSNVNLSSQGLWVLSEAEATQRERAREIEEAREGEE